MGDGSNPDWAETLLITKTTLNNVHSSVGKSGLRNFTMFILYKLIKLCVSTSGKENPEAPFISPELNSLN